MFNLDLDFSIPYPGSGFFHPGSVAATWIDKEYCICVFTVLLLVGEPVTFVGSVNNCEKERPVN
jgi:hypothetical protein